MACVAPELLSIRASAVSQPDRAREALVSFRDVTRFMLARAITLREGAGTALLLGQERPPHRHLPRAGQSDPDGAQRLGAELRTVPLASIKVPEPPLTFAWALSVLSSPRPDAPRPALLAPS